MVLQEVIGTYAIFMILSLWNYWKVEDTTLEVPWDQRVLPNTLKQLGSKQWKVPHLASWKQRKTENSQFNAVKVGIEDSAAKTDVAHQLEPMEKVL